MNQITIRKSVRKDIKAQVPELVARAKSWMSEKYPSVNFDNAAFIFSAGYKRSRYFRNNSSKNPKYSTPNVCICTRGMLMLYNKRSLGINKTHLFVGPETQMMCALIHELTHHAQYEQDKRKGNELDTTRNELEYLEKYRPDIYAEIIT